MLTKKNQTKTRSTFEDHKVTKAPRIDRRLSRKIKELSLEKIFASCV